MAVVLLLALAVSASAGERVVLGDRPGGFVDLHIAQAARWLRRGVRLELAGDQMSAAAIQVAWYRSHGGHVCARRGMALYFHASRVGRAGKRTDATRRILGYSLKEGWYSPADFGIRPCR